ncbi:hypothetical protein [Phyllobacterium sp. A18/5-2]|uniref:hypothetical protein n=1 Tax=Phyllobacterium sp. A18/5-2 TaxID=2978392 RepID=UPI003965B36E
MLARVVQSQFTSRSNSAVEIRDPGIQVLEMHNLLAETVAVPEDKEWILDKQLSSTRTALF